MIVSMLGMIWVLLTPYGQNYLHLSESIGLEIVQIVSSNASYYFLVIVDISAYIQI